MKLTTLTIDVPEESLELIGAYAKGLSNGSIGGPDDIIIDGDEVRDVCKNHEYGLKYILTELSYAAASEGIVKIGRRAN